MDYRVLDSQVWLNRTYGDLVGWEALDEDGITGWQTIYGLRRALQVELGVSPLGTAFGDMTKAAFVEHVGRIDTTVADHNLLMILSCSLWCKGVAGLGPDYYAAADGPTPTYALVESSVGYLWGALGLGTSAAPYVDVKMMVWLLSMDTYRLLAGGTTTVQGVQRWLNGAYAGRPGVAMVAADGVFTRPMQQALMIAVQLEIGFSDDEANGVFGPQTQGRLSGDPAYPYYRGPYFPHLFQSLLTVNGYPLVVDGDIGAGTLRAAGQFRYFMGLATSDAPASSSVLGHYGTWAALLVSCGDPDRAVTGFDHRLQLPRAALQDAWNQGYRVVGRYTVGTTTDENGVTLDKFVDGEEIQAMKAVGMDLLPIHQRMENSVSWMTYDYGYIRGTEATQRAHVLGLPENSIVYFAVDFDAYGATVDGPVRDFFRGINDAVNEVAATYPMRVGVYGARNVCDRVVTSGLAVSSFVAGITYGWSGNMGFPMPASWRYNQIKETTLTLGGAVRHVDKFDVARNAQPVSIAQVTGPPPELDGSATATGFSVFFDWLICAVHASTRHVGDLSSEESIRVAPYAVMAWLQQRYYSEWYWQLYIPETNWFVLLQRDLQLTIEAAQFQLLVDDLQAPLDAYGPPGDVDREKELSHFAASFRGHLLWGSSTDPVNWNPGDLGGWGLDLLQVWGAYVGQRGSGLPVPGSPADVDGLYEFAVSYIGGAAAESGFSAEDLRADADAYLLARQMRGDTTRGLVEDMRALVSVGPTARAQRFFDYRFEGSAANIGRVFLTLVEARPFEGIFAERFMEALNAVSDLPPGSPMPDLEYCNALGRALAVHLSSD